VLSSASRLIAESLVWDNHGCMPLRHDDESFLPQLARYRDSGVDIASLNVGFDALPWENTVHMIAQFRRWISLHNDHYQLVQSVEDVQLARESGRLGVCFDIEGGNSLNADAGLVQMYYDLGVRWMLMAYNQNNLLGGGCMDDDCGLTDFGREVISEMQRVGMVVCCSHAGPRTASDILEFADQPVIFSHSNPLGIYQHPRNISDDLIRACGDSGGVIGINGIGVFLGKNDNRTETFVRHLDYVVQLVGSQHVGLGLDFVFDDDEVAGYIRKFPHLFPPEDGVEGEPARSVRPEQLEDIVSALLNLGYSDDDLRAILGGNHLRVATAVWK
jgi:membrane dipeptidase